MPRPRSAIRRSYDKAKDFFAKVRSMKGVITALGNYSNQWPISPAVNAQKLIEQYKGWVFTCARRNSQAVAQTPLRLYVITQKGDKPPRARTKPVKDAVVEAMGYESHRPFVQRMVRMATRVEEVLEHPFLDVMAQANPIHDGFEVIETIQMYQELIGTAFLYKIRNKMGTVVGMFPLLSQYVQIVPDAKTFIKAYKYGFGHKQGTFKPEEIIRFRMPNPKDYFYGMSPLQAAANAVTLQNHMDDYQDALFRNSARPDQLLVPDNPMSDFMREKAEKSFNKAMRGPSSAGKTIMMPYGIKLEQLNFSPKEMRFLLDKTTRDDIAAIFDIPATLMAPTGGGRNKDEAAEYMHAKYGIWPRCRRLEQRLNQDLVSEYDGRLFCAFDSPVPRDKDFALKKRTADIRSGAITINETREDDGLPPVEWGNEPLLPSNVVPLSESIATQQANRKSKEQEPGSAEPAPGDDVKPGRTKSPDGKDKKEK